MRSATAFLTWLFFCIATAPAGAQSPSAGQEILPVGEQATVEGRSTPPAVLLPLHVQPVTSEQAPVGVTPLPPAPPHREATPPAVSFEEAGVPSKVEASETVPQPLQAAGGPVGFPDRYATTAGTTLSISVEAGVLKNDLDADDEALTVTILNETQTSGDVTLFADGRFIYTPPEGFSGTDTFQYKLRDASFNPSDYVTVSIDVYEGNRPPTGLADRYATLAGTPLSISAATGVLTNDLDPDGEALTVTILNESQTSGDVTLFSDGHFTYTPLESFSGTDTFQYRMRDASFNQTDYVTVSIDVYEGNRPPLGTDDVYAVLMDTPLSVSAEAGILTNDLDLDGEALTVTILNETQTSGDVTLFADGRFTYTPAEGFTGTDTFQYKMRDASFNQTDYVTVAIEVLDPQAPPLPVELASFEAQVDRQAVVLRWTTLTETNNAGFEVEQRTDSTWARIGFVDGFGTTVESREYVHRIEAVTPGRYTFRLKQIDFDGAFEYSPEVEIHLQPTAFRLAANYPNPFNPSTTIAFEVPEAVPVRVVVYDLLGRTVATLVDEVVEAGRHDVVWNARDAAGQPVASGLYLYRMEAGAFSQTHRMTFVK